MANIKKDGSLVTTNDEIKILYSLCLEINILLPFVFFVW